MDEFESLSHSKWECKYYVVFIVKFRRKVLYGELRKHLGEVFRKLAEQRESRVEEGHLMPDHVHMLLSIPPKYAVSQVVGYIKGKSAILRGAQAWVHRAALLGAWIFRLDRRSGRKSDPRLYQEPGEGRSATGSIESVALNGCLGSPINRGRVSVPLRRFERLTSRKPRLCWGMVIARHPQARSGSCSAPLTSAAALLLSRPPPRVREFHRERSVRSACSVLSCPPYR